MTVVSVPAAIFLVFADGLVALVVAQVLEVELNALIPDDLPDLTAGR